MAEIIKKIHHEGLFLNDPGYHSDATILSSVLVKKNSKRGTPYLDTKLMIRDCSTCVSLALDIDDAATLKNSLRKVQRMRENLEKLEEAMIIGYQVYKEEEKEYNAWLNSQTGKKSKKKK